VLLIAGLGVKAALIPLHGWLPRAMVAPAPVSALLHAVAVVKAGAFGIIRVVYDVYGVAFAYDLGVLTPLAVLAAATILYGSIKALSEDKLKRRLAYSTVSQVSYITLGVAVFGPLATIGGVVHLVHQGLMKITLFFCAGNYAETLGVHRVSEMDGIGQRMPLTSLAFTVGALGMIGIPPVAGFITKWYLGLGAVAEHDAWVLAVLAVSTLLNAAYFLPILYRVWFAERTEPWPDGSPLLPASNEAPPALLWPAMTTAALSLAAGLLAAGPASPLEWARLIALREYGL
jgi:multicomponent Na+:H+ antiporter subunit D